MMALDLLGDPVMRRDARFVADNRITLERHWAPGPRVCFIGCNPSTADAKADDPTCRWWIDWCQRLGYGGFTAVNLYPFCTSSPAECRRLADWSATNDWYARDAILFVNLPAIVETAKAADLVVACWGAIAWDDEWIEHVVEEIQTGFAPYPDIHCLGLTAGGAPKHPMARGKHRIPRDQQPILWRTRL